MPDARKAMVSLSEDIRPKPVKMPTNTAIGMVKVKTLGRMASEIAAISCIVADWRTMTSRRAPISRMKATNVRATSAITEGKKISLKMYRSRVFIREFGFRIWECRFEDQIRNPQSEIRIPDSIL